MCVKREKKTVSCRLDGPIDRFVIRSSSINYATSDFAGPRNTYELVIEALYLLRSLIHTRT